MKLDSNYLNSDNSPDLNQKTVSITNNDDPITIIGEKAFLSCKNIQELILPDTISHIEKWAFAHMKELRVLTIPANRITLAKEAFLDCPKLTEIKIIPDHSDNPGLSLFFGTLVGVLSQYSGVETAISSFSTLFTPDTAASRDHHAEWMSKYDLVIIDYISKPDNDGFKPEIIGWFNAESEDVQQEKYEAERRINKINLLFLRLRYDYLLSNSHRKLLYEYISESLNENNEIWELLSNELGKDILNIKIIESSGALTDESRIKLIELLNNSNGNPEVISYLLSKEKSHKSSDLWDSLEL